MDKTKIPKRNCPVLGCDSVTTDGLKFFRFPESNKICKELWCTFTKIKDFKPIPSETMCELHFTPDNITHNKHGKLYLRKNSIPTIYYKDGQKIIVQYDQATQQYVGYGAEIMNQELNENAGDKEKELVDLRYQKVCEIKNLCRFCFSNEKNSKCIAMSKLHAYSIDPDEMIKILGIDRQYEEAFNEIICMNCFDRLIEFHTYRHKCQKTQSELILSMQELDKQILEVQSSLRYQTEDTFTDWMKVETKLDETIQYEDNADDFFDTAVDDTQESYENQSSFEFFSTQPEISNTSLKHEPVDEFIDDAPDVLQRTDLKKPVAKKVKKPKFTDCSVKKYECFFCRKHFVGKKNFYSHKCEVKRIKCEVDGCDSHFTKQGGYNVHLQRRHKMPKISRHLCPVCKTNFQMSAVQFDEHCKKCSLDNFYQEKVIQCQKCKKIFKNLQTFTAHKMFHDAEDLTKNNEQSPNKEDGVKKDVNDVCYLCGKIFTNAPGQLKRHQVNVHLINFTGDLYYCDLCPIAKPTKMLLYSHMKSTHIIRWHACETCGKMFKNREGWRKHQLIHGDYKKNNFCTICPQQPGFATSSALKKHNAKHHGGAEPIRRFTCDIPGCGAAYSRDDQLTRHRGNVHQIFHNNYTENNVRKMKRI